jgi:hypothetical protein
VEQSAAGLVEASSGLIVADCVGDGIEDLDGDAGLGVSGGLGPRLELTFKARCHPAR